ncbi:MAG: energy transducer TonB family protein [Waterburya sp.]
MSISSFCIGQRQKEQQQLNKLLIFGFAGSALLHGLLGYALPYLSVEPPPVEKPMELIVVEQPKPKPKPKPQPKETKIVPKAKLGAKSGSSQPKAPAPKAEAPQPKAPEPKPEPKPEPPQPKAVEPKPQPPEPKPEAPQPKAPIPKKILTSNLPPVDNTPTVSQPQQAIAPSSNTSASAKDSSQVATNSSNIGGTGTGTDTGTGIGTDTGTGIGTDTGTGTGTGTGDEEGIACVNNCEPEYPAELEGAEGSAGVKLTIDPQGNVIGAELTDADENSQINRQALLAARQMEFSSLPDDNAVSVRVKIDFTVEGSEYDRLAREEQERKEEERKEQAAREKQEQETARQQQQQRQVEQAKIRQQQQQRQVEVKPKPPLPDNQVTPKPLPAPLETEADEEQLRKFRERIENYQQK